MVWNYHFFVLDMFLDVVDNYPRKNYIDVFQDDDVMHVIHLVFRED